MVFRRRSMGPMTDTKPAILAVDDEPEVLRAVQRDLRARYSGDYRILGATGGAEAQETIDELAARGDYLALIVADQRMPQVTGVDLLRHSMTAYPTAKRTLLTAYADTEAAISAINDVGLDHYIMKPWSPPEELLFPVLDDLLDDWQAGFRPVFKGIRVVAQKWSKEAFGIRQFLARNQVPYRSVTPEEDDGRALMGAASAEIADLPLVCFPDGGHLKRPSETELAQEVGLHSQATGTTYDVAIVGGGPAGLAAAVYGASEGLSTVLIESEAPGGQAGQSSLIENYLGFPKGIGGADLARRAASQATRLGAEIVVPATVESVERNDPYKVLHMADGSNVACKALVVASGVSYRKLEADGVDSLVGAGVYYGASTFEAGSHADRPMFVVGGGNSAGQAALFLSRFSDQVTILIRRSDLSDTMSQYLIDNIDATDSVTVRPRSQVVAAVGDSSLDQIHISNLDTGDVTVEEASALFILIGQAPKTDWIADTVELDDRGFLVTGDDVNSPDNWNVGRDPLPLETSVPGIFGAGDVRHGSIRRVAGATGEGATAIRFVHQHLADL